AGARADPLEHERGGAVGVGQLETVAARPADGELGEVDGRRVDHPGRAGGSGPAVAPVVLPGAVRSGAGGRGRAAVGRRGGRLLGGRPVGGGAGVRVVRGGRRLVVSRRLGGRGGGRGDPAGRPVGQ